jgi:uncharacterized membrane protein HdeD (DUF308 family)
MFEGLKSRWRDGSVRAAISAGLVAVLAVVLLIVVVVVFVLVPAYFIAVLLIALGAALVVLAPGSWPKIGGFLVILAGFILALVAALSNASLGF